MDDLISRQAAINALTSHIMPHNNEDGTVTIGVLSKSSIKNILNKLPSAQPDSKELSFTHKALDTISRQAAIRWVKTECNPYGKPTLDFESGKKVIEHLKQMPSAQPETHEKRTETHTCDYINRKDAIDAHYEYCNKHPDAGFPVWSLKILEDLPSAQQDLSGYSDRLWKAAYERGKAEALAQLEEAYISGETEAEARFHAQQRWIPCSERLPEEDGDYWVTADPRYVPPRYRSTDVITWRGGKWVMADYFVLDGEGRKMPDFKVVELAVPIIAWMPLPKEYQEVTDGTGID